MKMKRIENLLQTRKTKTIKWLKRGATKLFDLIKSFTDVSRVHRKIHLDLINILYYFSKIDNLSIKKSQIKILL